MNDDADAYFHSSARFCESFDKFILILKQGFSAQRLPNIAVQSVLSVVDPC